MTTNAKLREAMLKAARQGAQAADSGVNRLTANAGEQWLDAIAKETVEHIRRAIASAGYQFEWNDGNGTMYVESYRDESTKSDVLRGISYYDQKQVAAGLGIWAADVCD